MLQLTQAEFRVWCGTDPPGFYFHLAMRRCWRKQSHGCSGKMILHLSSAARPERKPQNGTHQKQFYPNCWTPIAKWPGTKSPITLSRLTPVDFWFTTDELEEPR